MTIYNLVKQIMEDQPSTRNSDKELIWQVWRAKGLICGIGYFESHIGYFEFRKAPSPETIRRNRQKIQQNYPYLRATKKIKEARENKRQQWADVFGVTL